MWLVKAWSIGISSFWCLNSQPLRSALLLSFLGELLNGCCDHWWLQDLDHQYFFLLTFIYTFEEQTVLYLSLSIYIYSISHFIESPALAGTTWEKSYIKLNILKSRNHHVILPYYPILLLINKPDSLPFYFSPTCRYYSRLLFKYIKVA